ncbi:MAG: hypothetical protein B6244_01835 [Candidatus Cloacimonetes bacterium 4572_55]|nr:MAG: hypothetical protein B6244_01835 [Candidatus Cloacimonetes bacterium 4572_55]
MNNWVKEPEPILNNDIGEDIVAVEIEPDNASSGSTRMFGMDQDIIQRCFKFSLGMIEIEQEATCLSGRIQFDDRRSKSHISVFARDEESGGKPTPARTGRVGFFKFRGLESGRYSIYFSIHNSQKIRIPTIELQEEDGDDGFFF